MLASGQEFEMSYEVVVFTCLTLSSMIGAGVLVIPKAILPFGFAGTIGWIAASICSFVLAKMFVEIVLSQKTDASSGIPGIIKSEYGPQQAFSVGLGQWLFICFGSSAVALVFIRSLANLIGLSNPIAEFLISSGVIIFFTILYHFSTAALGILSLLTFIKVLLFSTTSILGITDFNFNNFFGIYTNDIHGIFPTIKYAFTHLNGESISFWSCMSGIFKSCSTALFAFAGMESAASSSSSVKDPKKTIPKATVMAVVISSAIFILTHICTINALGGNQSGVPIDEEPVKTAVQILTKRHFGDSISVIAGNVFTILAMVGCFGSVMTFCFTAPNCLYDTLSIAYPDLSKKFPRSKTGFPIQTGVASACVMSSIIFFNYFINSSISIVLDYSLSLLISSYTQCAFVHLKRGKNLLLSFGAIFVCFFLMSGCSLPAIVFGLVISYIGNIIFLLLSKDKKEPEILDMEAEKKPIETIHEDIEEEDL